MSKTTKTLINDIACDITDNCCDNQILSSFAKEFDTLQSLDEENIKKIIMDMSNSVDLRLSAITKFFSMNSEETLSIISNITGIYSFNGAKNLETLLFRICTMTDLSSFLKVEAVKGLLNYEEQEEDIESDDDEQMIDIKTSGNENIRKRNNSRQTIAFKALNTVCESFDNFLATPCRVDAIFSLMKCSDYKNNSKEYFNKLINDQKLDCDYRYKIILSLEKLPKFPTTFDYTYIFFMESAQTEFINNNKNMTYYRILSGQYILLKLKINIEETQNILLSFAKDLQLDYNLRADSADILLNLGNTQKVKDDAREIINILGRVNGSVKSVFDNAQNVHSTEIEKSSLENLQKLIEIKHIMDGGDITFSHVKTEIENILKNKKDIVKEQNKSCKEDCNDKIECGYCCKCLCNDELCQNTTIINLDKEVNKFCSVLCKEENIKEEKIGISLNRIAIDRMVYSIYNKSLSNILIIVWSYIQQHDQKEAMLQRLIEELIDTSGTCATGYASRLVNVISGFGEFSIKISWEDQIVANFTGRLNACVRNIDSENSIYFTEEFQRKQMIAIYKKYLKTEAIKTSKEKKIDDDYEDEEDDYDKETREEDEKVSMTINNFKQKQNMNALKKQTQDKEEDEKIDIKEAILFFKSEVINEMSFPPSEFRYRINFLKFFRDHMLKIREELYLEFKEYITDEMFDLYIRKAISSYEGC